MSVKIINRIGKQNVKPFCEKDYKKCQYENTPICFTCGIYNGKELYSKFTEV